MTSAGKLNVLTGTQLVPTIVKMVQAGLSLLITGMPGVGKTAVWNAALAILKTLHPKVTGYLWHPAISDPTDFKGMPMFDSKKGTAHFKPFDNLRKLTEVQPDELVVVLLDDLAQALEGTQAALMQCVWAKEIDGVKIPDNVIFLGATNRLEDMAGVNTLIEPLKGRFKAIVEMRPDVDSWADWAYGAGITEYLIGFIRACGVDMLADFQPTTDITNSATPRTWEAVSDIEKLSLPPEIEQALMAGAVGDGKTLKYLTFREMYKQLVDVDDIIAHPSTAAIPSGLDQMFAVSVALANAAEVTNVKAIGVYAERLLKARHGEFAALILRDMVKRNPTLGKTKAYADIQCGPLGQLLSGNGQAN